MARRRTRIRRIHKAQWRVNLSESLQVHHPTRQKRKPAEMRSSDHFLAQNFLNEIIFTIFISTYIGAKCSVSSGVRLPSLIIKVYLHAWHTGSGGRNFGGIFKSNICAAWAEFILLWLSVRLNLREKTWKCYVACSETVRGRRSCVIVRCGTNLQIVLIEWES